MLVPRRALPLCVLFLCAAGDAPQGVCDNEKCSAFFREFVDNTKAGKRCEDTGGTLYDVQLWGGRMALPLPHGHFWIKAAHTSDSGCSSVFVSLKDMRFENRTCADALDGVVCQYTMTCRALSTTEDAQYNYTSAWVYERQMMFPPGTVAVLSGPGRSKISKHLCTGTQWINAPWICEVLYGGCEHQCSEQTCLCPKDQTLHDNGFTCTEDPSAPSTHDNEETEGKFECREGFRLVSMGNCVDVDECSENKTLCSGELQMCENTEGSYRCTCQGDYDMVSGVCMDCPECQHFCDLVQGEFRCMCEKGYRVHPQDPTKCESFCSEQDCPADCPGEEQCHCPSGYIPDKRDSGTFCTDIDECEEHMDDCEHFCNNTWGDYVCSCQEGYQLQDMYQCELLEILKVSGQSRPTAAPTHPTALPSYVKTGSILGITVFALLCAALIYFLVHRMFIYCTKMQFYSVKQDMEIFTLQQVSTEKYKKLSHDWQFRNDCHRL